MNKGYVIMLNVLFLTVIAGIIVVWVVNPILSNYASAKSLVESKKAFILADSATNEAYYRLTNSVPIGSSSSITLSSSTANIAVSTTLSGKDIQVTSPNTYQRNVKLRLALGTGISFHYGIQSGRGGFVMENSSSVTGSVFSGGVVTGAGNYIYGDVVSSGSSGLINGIHATGTAFAHTIQNSTVDKDAYYVTKTGTMVYGTSYPNSPDQPDVELPITDAQISEWEAEAAAGGTVTCSGGKYTITEDITIGPKKIPCDLLIKGTGIVVTVSGHLWVTGNITTQTGPIIKMSPNLGSQNVAIIADNPSDRLTSSIINIGQSTGFENSGTAGSFVFMISQNSSAESGGSVEAISVGQSSSALVAYASHGLISLSQSINLTEATAYKISLKNTANITYVQGLASSIFTSGPSGGYTRIEWNEI